MRAKLLISFISIASLLLIQACNSSSGGGGGGTPAPDNGQSSKADITSLVITVSDTDHTVDFDDARQATINYPYGSAAPATITIKSIVLSADATSDYGSGGTIGLNDGKAIITVTAQDATEQTYTIRIVAEENSAAIITSLTLKLIDSTSDSSKSISFDATTTEATIEYQYTQDTTPATIQLTSIDMSAGAIVAIGDATTDGSNNLPVAIAISGANPSVEIMVTAEDGNASKTYTITISLSKVSTNSLKEIIDLGISLAGSLGALPGTDKNNIAFNADHTATVSHEFPYGFNESDLPDSIFIGNIAVSAGASTNVPISRFVNIDNSQDSRIVTITVTAADGSTQAYTLRFNITIAKNTEANINTLVVTVSGEDHTVSFDANMEATINYPYGSAAPATITIKSISLSADATSDYAGGEAINVSSNQVTITVTAQDGSQRAYTIQLVQTAASSEAAITSLVVSVSGVDHTVSFDDARQATINYPYGNSAPTTITIKNISLSADATSDYGTGATISVENNQATITVTAQDGTTAQSYTINLVQTPASSEAAITSLIVSVSGVVQSIEFDANRQASAYYPYGDSTPDSVRITSIVMSAGATASVANDQIVDLVDNTLTITVTAQDDTSKNTYSIFFVELKTLKHILDSTIGNSQVPADFSGYDELTQAVLTPYKSGANLIARYVTIDGGSITTQGGTSWSDALPANQLKSTLDGISDAGADKVYLILVASGATADASYDAGSEMKMKNHVALIGGWEAGGGWGRSGTTVLSGGGSHRVFNNDSSSHSTALLYGLTIAAGSSTDNGGGIYNNQSSPTLSNITLSANSADYGGGIYNNKSSPSMSNITLSANSVTRSGGGIYNYNSSPSMSDITLSANSASDSGGGIYNSNSSPSMSNITLSANSADYGSGIYNINSSPSMSNITLSANEAIRGGGIYNNQSSPTLTNITLSANSADYGGGIYNYSSSLTLINATFAGNKATSGGGIYIQNRKATTIVGSIFWDNSADTGAQIYINEATGDPITLAYSVIQGGAPANITTSTNLVTTDDPSLADLTTDTGSAVATHAISTGSSAINAGIYVRRSGSNYYYSTDNSSWYSDFTSDTDSTGGLITSVTLPTDSIDITATDATGTARSNRPDAGAYEARQ